MTDLGTTFGSMVPTLPMISSAAQERVEEEQEDGGIFSLKMEEEEKQDLELSNMEGHGRGSPRRQLLHRQGSSIGTIPFSMENEILNSKVHEGAMQVGTAHVIFKSKSGDAYDGKPSKTK